MSAPEPTPDTSSGTTSQANLGMIISQSLGMAAQNAVVAQQMGNILHSATTALGVDVIYSNTQKTTTSPKSLTQVLQDMQQAADTLKNIENKSVDKD